jgi:hypothetical protein
LWVRAALRALLARIAGLLRTPPPPAVEGDHRIDGPLARAIAGAAATGAPVTPFGAPAPAPPQLSHRPGEQREEHRAR